MITVPTATPIDLNTYARRYWYEHFCQFEIPITYRTIQIDVTALKQYCKQNNLKFSLTLGFILTRANNYVREFRHRIVNDTLVEYDRIIPAFTVLQPNKVFAIAKGVYTDNFADDYHVNLSNNDSVATGQMTTPPSEHFGQIFITTNPWTTQTAVQAPYSKRFASMPVFCAGRMYDDAGRIKLGLGLQVHHGLVDGYHIGHLVDIVQRHLEDPAIIEGHVVSTFEQRA
jgi:chloramphenicol O-acetyltransferase type A